MKFVLIAIVFVWNIGKAQTIKTTGQLIDFTEAKMPAYCGYQIEYGILKIRIEKNISNFKVGDSIYIFQTCPRETMEREVGRYLNNTQYLVEIGKKVSKTDLVHAEKIFKKNYPEDRISKIFYGHLSKLK